MKTSRLLCLALLLLAANSFLFAAKKLEITNIRKDYYDNDLNIYTNPDIKTSIDKSLIEINPPVQFKIHPWGDVHELSAGFSPGKIYRITFKKGFPSTKAKAKLQEDYTYIFVTPDLRPKAFFASRGVFFPLHAPIWELPVTTVNIGETLH